MNDWKKIWNKKEVISNIPEDFEKLVLELKRLNGFESVGYELNFSSYKYQYDDIKKELGIDIYRENGCAIKSIFEVGCGSGANLYMFAADGLTVGGIDYSNSLIQTARKVLPEARELICGEAKELPTEIKYDACLSNSVFSYFENEEYAWNVLTCMKEKTNRSIGLLDVHDLSRKHDFIEYRKKVTSDYEERYKNLPKLFYERDFFKEFAFENRMTLKLTQSTMPGYWNNEFVFNVYMIKE